MRDGCHAGMICPHIVNVSMLLGAILTWGWLWPYIDGRAGEWYPEGLKEHDFKGLFGYKVSSPVPMHTCCACFVRASLPQRGAQKGQELSVQTQNLQSFPSIVGKMKKAIHLLLIGKPSTDTSSCACRSSWP